MSHIEHQATRSGNPLRSLAPEIPSVRLTILQYGDYAEASARLSAGGAETYYAQNYTVEFIADLARRPQVENVTVVNFGADREKGNSSGVNTHGVRLYAPDARPRLDEVLQVIKQSDPTHLIVAAPIAPVIRWGLSAGVKVLPLFADSFRGGGLRGWIRAKRLASLLNRREIAFVANHNLAASLDLARIGVAKKKILPFDWPELIDVSAYASKSAPSENDAFKVLYVGQISVEKGVADAIRALSILRSGGRNFRMTLIGSGDIDGMAAIAEREGVADLASFLGRKPHPEVLAMMRNHDAVIVPSHHAYPEGLPMTIYEALCVRTPLVVSDHPMFALRIRDGSEALVHKERDPKSIAAALSRLATDSLLYEQLSQQAATSIKGYLCPLKWDKLVEAFISEDAEETLKSLTLDKQLIS